MPGGSPEPDDRDEEDQCQHCGRWYSQAGVLSHEEHCELSLVDERMHDLVSKGARYRAGLMDSLDDVMGRRATH